LERFYSDDSLLLGRLAKALDQEQIPIIAGKGP